MKKNDLNYSAVITEFAVITLFGLSVGCFI